METLLSKKNRLRKAPTILAVDIAEELIIGIKDQCNQIGFEIVRLAKYDRFGVNSGVNSGDLILVNLDSLVHKITKLPVFLKKWLKDCPCIGIYSYHPNSIAALSEYINLHYLVPAGEYEHILFAIRRGKDYLTKQNIPIDAPSFMNVESWENDFMEKNDFVSVLEKNLNRLGRKQNGSLALIEIDHYTTRGNAASKNGTISDIMNLLNSRCRPFDLIGKFGPTTFAFFSTRFNTKSFTVFVEHLRITLSDNLYEDSGEFHKLKCSIGVSFWDDHTANTKELIARAEQACAKASIGDGNQVQIHQNITTSMNVVAGQEKSHILIHTAISQNRFRLIFQPIVMLTYKSTENYAVLLRMIDNDGQQMAPDQFLPVAEKEGLSSNIDQWVLKQTIEVAKKSYAKYKRQKFFIKISRSTVLDDRLIRSLFYYLKKANIDGKALVFQIDYADYINNKEESVRFIHAVKKARCDVAFDHFGYGSYSVSELKELPLDFVKIDGTFTRQLLDKQPYRETVETIQKFARECGIRTIAKSVENANTLALLWKMRVDAAQGYFIQRPEEQMRFSFPT